VVLGSPLCRGRVFPTFWTCIFKLHLIPSMLAVLFQFRSVSSDGSCQKTKMKKIEELDDVAINDTLPHRAARCYATANLKSFLGPGTPAN